MKTLVTLLITFLISLSSFAQGNSINYKAIIKDGSGNILSSSTVTIQFIIYEGAALTNNVYQESHSTNTDANGLIIVNIGEGSTSDDFNLINWGNDNHFLNVQVDTGSGLVDLSTTEFKTVPYALHAKNVTGLIEITENDGLNDKTGRRLKGFDSANYGPIGSNAIDLSASTLVSTTHGATGNNSVAMGNNITAPSFAETVLGQYNVDYTPVSTTSWDSNDQLFVIGNGTSDSDKNSALTVLKNGDSQFDGEIQRSATGNANMVPIAYGGFDGKDTASGTILSGTGNFTIIRLPDFTYEITVIGESLSENDATASVMVSANLFRTANVTYDNGKMLVHIFNNLFAKVPAPFQFVIYKE